MGKIFFAQEQKILKSCKLLFWQLQLSSTFCISFWVNICVDASEVVNIKERACAPVKSKHLNVESSVI